jgi:outer membrane receptor protein involved in Fe transport
LKGIIMRPLILLALPLLAACNDKQDQAEDKLERAAETSAKTAGPIPAALGLSEAELLEADLVGVTGEDLGDVAQVVRDTNGRVDRLLIEIDGIGDRYVHIPITGLKTVVDGDDTDLVTPMSKADLAALVEVKLPAP